MAAPRGHRWRIDAREYERHEQRRGRRFAYEAVDPRRTAPGRSSSTVPMSLLATRTPPEAHRSASDCGQTQDVGDADILAEKSAASAFFPGRSTLPDVLAERGVETVVIAGTVTNVCCESSARDASTLGYRVVMAADACAAVDDASHNATLRTIYRSFGDVRPTDEVVALFSQRVRSGRGRTR